MIRRYYEEEMRYLHEAGKVFAEHHPEQARYLNVGSIADRDPYVERLFEGFAFLSGRIREQLDDELHQYTEALCTLLCPHVLKPVPALSVVAFTPRPGEVQGTTVLKKGTEVRSGPAGDERVTCRFVTTQTVRLHPLTLQEATLHWDPDDTTRVALRFQIDGGATYEDLDLNPLRLHFVADPSVASLMHLFFTRHVDRMTIGVPHDPEVAPGEATITLRGQQWIQPGGGLAVDATLLKKLLGTDKLSGDEQEDEGLFPYSLHSFDGFRLLHEYLSYRRKFWCVDLYGLNRFALPDEAETFQVEIFFDRRYPEDKRFKGENVRLYCAPVVNIFEQDAEPVRVDHQTAEYRVLPSVRYRRSIEVYDVEQAVGIEDRTGRRHEYLPYFSFEHTRAPSLRYYTQTSRIGPTDHYETYLVLDSGEDDPSALAVESLSLALRCTNGSVPSKRLKEGMINQLAPEVPKVATPENLTQPTIILYPPTRKRKDFFWQLISHWSFNFQTVASKPALAGILALYDWTDDATEPRLSAANKRRIASIEDVAWAPKEVMYRGSILRGTEVTLYIQEGHFADEGDLCLFGLVLSRFLSMYATLNSFVHLTIEMMPSRKRYQWQPKNGTRPML